MNKTGKVLGTGLRVLGVALIAAVALLYLPLTAPRLLHLEIYAITSGSMAPEIPTGSVVYAEAAEPETLAAGDVVVFWAGSDGPSESAVTHRVVDNDVSARMLTTKGDANAVEDLQPVDYGSVIGRVKFHLPALGYAALILETGAGKLGSVAVIVLAAALYALGGALRGRGDPEKDQTGRR